MRRKERDASVPPVYWGRSAPASTLATTTSSSAAAAPVGWPAAAASWTGTFGMAHELVVTFSTPGLVHQAISLPRALSDLTVLPVPLQVLEQDPQRGLQFDQIQRRVAILVKVRQHRLGQLSRRLAATATATTTMHPLRLPTALMSTLSGALILSLGTAFALRDGRTDREGRSQNQAHDECEGAFHRVTFSFVRAARENRALQMR